jgi:preprotein translocase subunit SecG
MTVFISILIFIVAILLILVVLVQNSKGGGLSSSFGQPSQMMGVQQTADFLEKTTWGLAISLMVLCVIASAVYSGSKTAVEETGSELKKVINTQQIPTGFEQQPSEGGASQPQ